MINSHDPDRIRAHDTRFLCGLLLASLFGIVIWGLATLEVIHILATHHL